MITAIAKRILKQIVSDKKLIVLSVAMPLSYVFFLHITIDALPGMIQTDRYALPLSAFLIYFVTFLLSTLTLVGERRNHTLDRMRFAGITNFHLVIGYVVGYLVLAAIQTLTVIASAIYLFELSLDIEQIIALTIASILVAIAALLIGTFVSMSASREDQVIPFIPLVIIPSVLFSGMLVEFDRLPEWAQLFGKFFPPYWANNAIQELLKPTVDYAEFYRLLIPLGLYIIAVFAANQVVAKLTKR